MDEPTEGPTFRANKRRKVFRKRAGSEANDDQANVVTSPRPDQALPANKDTSVMTGEEDTTFRPDVARVRKPKKHGIAFSSTDRTSSRPQNNNEETALVVAEPQPVEQQNGRFTKQTGKTIVEDDKHMSAYIDSKLAELRYGSSTPNTTTTQKPSHTPTGQPPTSLQAQPPPNRDVALLSPPKPSSSGTQQPTNPPKPPQHPPPSRRKNRNARQSSPSTTARASLVDQILRESNHTPHYTPSASASASNTNGGTDGTTLDPDAAAAEAFKADFLAQAEARNLSRRQPAANASASSSSGPKLGGSRAARERMRAAEEAKGKK